MLEVTLDIDESVTESPEIDLEEKNNKVSEWFVATVFSWILGVAIFYLPHDYFLIEDRIKISGSSIVGGLFNTAWFVLDFPGSSLRYGINGYITLCFSIFIGVLTGGAIGWIYIWILQYRSKKK